MAEVKKPVAVAKKAAAKKVETVKAEVKKAAEKVEAKKAETKAAAKTEEKVEAKAPAKTTAKAAVKKAVKKTEPKTSLNVQFAGRDYTESELIKMAKVAYKKDGNKDALKTLNVYANVDDQMAYYVANGKINGQFEI